VILLRLEDERTLNKIEVVRNLLQSHGERLGNQFEVVTEQQVRFAQQ
jgi:hypothetical protein